MSIDDPTTQPAEPIVVGYAPLDKPKDRWGKGFLAVTTSILLPGLGHLIAGRRRRAVFWFLACHVVGVTGVACLAHPATLLAAVGLGAIEILLVLAMLIDAFVHGRRSERRILGSPWLRYAAGIGCLIVANFANPRVLLAYYLRDHYAEAFIIRGGAMSPTLVSGDRLLAHKRTDPHRWSIVVFESPQWGPASRFPSRVVGLPGETIEIVGGQVQVDGQPVTPPPGLPGYVNQTYIGRYDVSLRGKPGAGCEGNPIHLGPEEYYILGDSTATAIDSRLWETPAEGHQLGALPRDHIIGRVTAIYWPPSRWRLFKE